MMDLNNVILLLNKQYQTIDPIKKRNDKDVSIINQFQKNGCLINLDGNILLPFIYLQSICNVPNHPISNIVKQLQPSFQIDKGLSWEHFITCYEHFHLLLVRGIDDNAKISWK